MACKFTYYYCNLQTITEFFIQFLICKFNERSVRADNFINMNENTLDNSFLFCCHIILHLHCFVDKHNVSGINLLTGLHIDLDDTATHGSAQ